MLSQSFYLRKCCGAQLLFHQQNYTQLYVSPQLEVTPNFYALCSTPCTINISINLLVQKNAHRTLMKLTPSLLFFFFTPFSLDSHFFLLFFASSSFSPFTSQDKFLAGNTFPVLFFPTDYNGKPQHYS